MSEIEFYFDPSDGDGLSMRIDSTPDEFADEGGYRGELSNLVTSFQVVYFDGFEWLEEWFEDGLPQAVEFRITFVDPADIDDDTGQPREYQVSRLVTLPAVRPVDPLTTQQQQQTQGGTRF
jgi:hypothetical protein